MKMKEPTMPKFRLSDDDVFHEALIHSQDVYSWRVYMTHVRHEYEDAVTDCENVEAELYEQARVELAMIDSKAPTEKRIATWVANHHEVKARKAKVSQLKKKYELVRCVVEALDTKTSMLKALNYSAIQADKSNI